MAHSITLAAVVTALSALSRLVGRRSARPRGPWAAEAFLHTPVAYVIGSVAAFWVVQRVVAFGPYARIRRTGRQDPSRGSYRVW